METTQRKLAVGWFDNTSFVDACAPYVPRIKEVFFAWPGVTASRPMDDWTSERRARIVADLKWARENGIELDTIFNANCYGDICISDELADHVTEKLREMDAEGLFPQHLTTASPFIATVVRQRFPSVKIRFSINMDIASTSALSYVDELYDEFYAGRNDHRTYLSAISLAMSMLMLKRILTDGNRWRTTVAMNGEAVVRCWGKSPSASISRSFSVTWSASSSEMQMSP